VKNHRASDTTPLGPRDGSTVTRESETRTRILALLRAHGEPMTLSALSASTGLHVNTLRGHLDELLDAGAVSRSKAPASGRGRPASLYVADGPDPGPGGEYAGLATALAVGLARSSRSPRRAAERAGRVWGQDLAREAQGAGDSGRRVLRVLERMGFAPRATDEGRSLRLTRCPLLQVARAHQDVVCGVHLGIVQGVLEESGESWSGTALHPFAEPGACVLTLPDKVGRRAP
jgi:predicted ArsR family transcriptional regulator